MHCAIDDRTRLAYAEIHLNETAVTCADFLRAAAEWVAGRGIGRIERVMTDNGMAERFIRNLADEWAHIQPSDGPDERADALPD